MLKIDEEKARELSILILGEVEGLLESKGIRIILGGEEKIPNEAYISGQEYFALEGRIADILIRTVEQDEPETIDLIQRGGKNCKIIPA